MIFNVFLRFSQNTTTKKSKLNKQHRFVKTVPIYIFKRFCQIKMNLMYVNFNYRCKCVYETQKISTKFNSNISKEPKMKKITFLAPRSHKEIASFADSIDWFPVTSPYLTSFNEIKAGERGREENLTTRKILSHKTLLNGRKVISKKESHIRKSAKCVKCAYENLKTSEKWFWKIFKF